MYKQRAENGLKTVTLYLNVRAILLRFLKIFILLPALLIWLVSCAPNEAQKPMQVKADSLDINLRCMKTVTKLISDNFLLPGYKKVQYKIEYISETWPDTITTTQAAKITNLKNMGTGFEELVNISKELQLQSTVQLEQLKKLNNQINSGAVNSEQALQYLTFESKCADTLNRVLDTLVKKSIMLSCKSQSI